MRAPPTMFEAGPAASKPDASCLSHHLVVSNEGTREGQGSLQTAADLAPLKPGGLVWAKMPGFRESRPRILSRSRLTPSLLCVAWYPALINGVCQTNPAPSGKPIKHEINFAFPARIDHGGYELTLKNIKVRRAHSVSTERCRSPLTTPTAVSTSKLPH